jgi:putative SOS response-associated peptidase YedK
MQPVIYTNDDGERQRELMRWALKLPDRFLFNARSEGIERSKFGRMPSLPDVAFCQAMQSTNGKKLRKARRSPKYEFTIPGQHPFGMAAVWKLWKNPKTNHWEKTFAVLTGEPNELMAPIHDRMTRKATPVPADGSHSCCKPAYS